MLLAYLLLGPALANISAVAIHPAVAVILALDVVFKNQTL
jgi:hypothetical protein